VRRYVLMLAAAAFLAGSCRGFASAQAPRPEPSRIYLGLRAGLGYETETGLPWSLEPRVGLDLSWPRLYSYAEVSSAFGRLDWREDLGYRALDTASLGLGYKLLGRPCLALKAEALCKYRDLGDETRETCLGAVLGIDVGAVQAPRGLFFRGAFGYSFLFTSFADPEAFARDLGPIIRLSLCARPVRKLLLNLTLSDYTGSDVSVFGKTFFELGCAVDLGGPSLGASAMLKYSDFFTLTSSLDGYAFRLTGRLPLCGNKRLEALGLW
jgi:hypothetical protein